MEFESLIFDIDGTLWDSRALVAEGYNIQLEREGLSHLFVTEEILRPLFGKVMTEIADALLASIPATVSKLSTSQSASKARSLRKAAFSSSERYFSKASSPAPILSRPSTVIQAPPHCPPQEHLALPVTWVRKL